MVDKNNLEVVKMKKVLVIGSAVVDVALDRAMLDDYSLYVYLSDASVE